MLMARMRETDSAARKGSADPLHGTVQSHPRKLASVRAHTQRPHMPCGRTYARAITWARAVTHLSSVKTQKIFRVPPPAAPASPPLPTRAATRTSAAKANQEGWCKARTVERVERGRLSYMRHGIARETNMKTNMKTVRISPTQYSEQTRKRLEIVAEERWRRCG